MKNQNKKIFPILIQKLSDTVLGNTISEEDNLKIPLSYKLENLDNIHIHVVDWQDHFNAL